MRSYCGIIFSFLFFFAFSSALSAQVIPDSIPVGVINVQRPAIKPAYHVEVSVMYETTKKDRRSDPEVPNKFVFSDSTSNFFLPQPSLEYMFRTSRPTDSLFSLPPEPSVVEKKFDWPYYLERIPHQYAWSDSTRSDSARFIYSVDKRGKATCKPIPWRNADSATVAFEKKTFLYMAHLSQWSPARKAKRATRDLQSLKTKTAACTVIVTVYAYDPNAGRLLPLELEGE